MRNKLLSYLGKQALIFSLKLRLPIKILIKKTIYGWFCGGQNLEECNIKINDLGDSNIYTYLSYSIEGEETEAEFEKTLDENLKQIQHIKNNKYVPFCSLKLTGLGNIDLLAKVQNDEKLTDEEKNQFQNIKNRVYKIADEVFKADLKLMIDAEETWVQKILDDMSLDLMIKYNKNKTVIYATYQFYCKDTLEKMKQHYDKVTKENVSFGVKFVRGAYMEKEQERANLLNYPNPIQSSKEDTDRDFNLGLIFAIEHIHNFSFCVATHNEDSINFLLEKMKEKNISKDDERIYFAQLLGMSDNVSYELAKDEFKVLKYVPYGPIDKAMPYLIRRIDENSSISSHSARELSLINQELQNRKRKKG